MPANVAANYASSSFISLNTFTITAYNLGFTNVSNNTITGLTFTQSYYISRTAATSSTSNDGKFSVWIGPNDCFTSPGVFTSTCVAPTGYTKQFNFTLIKEDNTLTCTIATSL